jgi:phosphatidylglycerophosphatase A
MRFLVYLLGTFFYAGRAPVAPGTAGSLAALAVFIAGAYFLPAPVFPLVLSLFVLGFFAISIPVGTTIARCENREDPSCVVIDEVVGQWTSFLFLPPALLLSHPWTLAAGFLLFRFFDIIKLFPANRAEGLPGGLGIVLDDVIAGIYACLALNVLVKMLSLN